MIFTTLEDFNSDGRLYLTKHGNRWLYMNKCIEIIKRFEPKKILELGTNGLPLCKDSDTMDIIGNNTFNHDATNIPWPIKDKSYDFFVALQVFEHLDSDRNGQIDCFNEARRVSKNIILSLPYMWRNSDAIHDNISDETILKWSNDLKWSEEYMITDKLKRKIYFWTNV